MKFKRKKSKFFSEFKDFITRGNVLDMAVGVIVGGAFTSIVNSLSNHILKPIINWVLALIFGQNSLSGIYTYLKKSYVEGTQEIDLANSIYIDWGEFINAIINFLLIAFVLFCIVKTINSIHTKMEETLKKAKEKDEEPEVTPEPEPEPEPEPDPQIVLLTEIRDLLEKKKEEK
mgnify:FL=1